MFFSEIFAQKLTELNTCLSLVYICKFITRALMTRGFWNASLIGMIATPGGVNYRTDAT